jgi:hypothetical protein
MTFALTFGDSLPDIRAVLMIQRLEVEYRETARNELAGILRTS